MLNQVLSPLVINIVKYVSVFLIVLYAYDYVFKKPQRDIEAAKETLTLECAKKQKMYYKALTIAGKNISELGQTVYDLNTTLRKMESENNTALTECKNTIEEMKWSEDVKKIDTNDKYFYVNFPFK